MKKTHGKSRTLTFSLVYLVFTAILISSFMMPLVNADTYVFATQWGGTGSGEGQFDQPVGIAVDSSGYIYVVDRGNNRVQKFTSDGVYVTQWGTEGSGNGQLDGPHHITIDSSGYIYVTEWYNNRVQKFTSDGVYVTKWGGYGTGDGEFKNPVGIAVDNSGYIYTTEWGGNNRVQKFTSDGVYVTQWGGTGDGDGQFSAPVDVAVDDSGYVYVTDQNNQRVQKFTSDGVYVTQWGSGGYGPKGVAVDGSGYVYVVNQIGTDPVSKFTSDGVFVTKFGGGPFTWPWGVAVDDSGFVYVSDMWSDLIQKFSLEDNTPPTGSIMLAAGADYTSNPTVTVGLSYSDDESGVKDVRFSDDGVFDSEEWENPPLFKIWTFSPVEGVKTLYMQVRDNAGNTAVFSDSVTLDTGPPTGSILINGGAASTTSAEVTLSLTYSDTGSGVSKVRYSNDGSWDTEPWESPSATKVWSLDGDNGFKTVYYQVKDNGGALSSTYSDDITLTTPAPIGSITINGGDAYTTSTSATLSLTYAASGSTVSQVRYSNDGVWDTEGWESPAATRAWTLTSGDGAKTVYYQIKNTEEVVSATYSDSIIFDTTPPTSYVGVAAGLEVINSTVVTVGFYSADENGVKDARVSEDGVFDTEEWGPPPLYKIWAFSAVEGVKTMYFQVRDNAGNTATSSDSVIFDATPPTGSIVLAQGEDVTGNPTMLVSLSYSDENGVKDVRFSVDGVFDSEEWESSPLFRIWTFSPVEGVKTLYMQVRDNAGNTAVFSDSVTLVDVVESVEELWFNVAVGETDFVVGTLSNSTVSALSFDVDAKKLSFTVNGTYGTAGFCNVSVPEGLMSGEFSLYLDDFPLLEGWDYTQIYNGTHYNFSLLYGHSSHAIEVFSTEVIPDFAAWLFLPFLTTATLLGLGLRRKLKKHRTFETM